MASKTIDYIIMRKLFMFGGVAYGYRYESRQPGGKTSFTHDPAPYVHNVQYIVTNTNGLETNLNPDVAI